MGRVRGQLGQSGQLVRGLIVILNTATLFVKLAGGASPERIVSGQSLAAAAAAVVSSDTQLGSGVVHSFAGDRQQLAKLTPPTDSHPIVEQTNQPQEEMSALVYLQRYGYMSAPNSNSGANSLISEDSFSSAVREFQKFAGISETGKLERQLILKPFTKHWRGLRTN